MFKKGDIVLVPFPFTDLSSQKVRPAIVLSSTNKGTDIIVIFISSKKPIRKYLYDIPIEPAYIAFEKTGLKVKSIIKVDKIATLDKKIVLGKLGVLPSDIKSLIDNKLKHLFGL